MAVHHITVTMTGSPVPILAANPPTTNSVNCQFLIIENAASNADVKVGGSTLSSTDYGKIVESGAAKAVTITGTQANPINLATTYLLGTNTQLVHCLYTA